MQQWVDITTISNTTPFSKVRWLANLNILDSSGWLEFSEVSGLTIDNQMDWWVAAGSEYGYASTHRNNWGDNTFTCTFLDEYRVGPDVSAPNPVMGEAVHDVARSQYYDNTVVINGQTYYEVDFSTWRGFTPLYYPYSGQAVTAGQVYVLVGTAEISGDKEKVSFKSTGGTNSVTITAVDDWTASASTNWFTVSTLSGTSGTTVVTITAPDYQDTTSARTGTITFECNGDTFELTVKQSKKASGTFGGLVFGSLELENMYFGDNALEGLYLGDLEIFSGPAPTPPTPTGETQYKITYTAPSRVSALYSSPQWGASLVSHSYDSTTEIGTIMFDGPYHIPSGGVSFHGKRLTSVIIEGAVDIMRGQGNYGAFSECTGLTEVFIGNSVTSITDSTFTSCPVLTHLEIGTGLTSLPNLMAPSCSTLSTLVFHGTTPPTVASGDDPFRACAAIGTLYVPGSSVSAYQSWIAGISSISGWTVTANVDIADPGSGINPGGDDEPGGDFFE